MTAWLPTLHWLRPHWLWALLPLAVLWLWLGHRQRRPTGWHALLAPALQPHLLDGPSGRSSRSGWWLLGLGWLLGVLALAGPSWSQQPQPAARHAQALVIVLDLTATMLAEDTPPSRLVRARHKVLELIDRQPDALVGLVAYAGDAHLVSPLTDDHSTLRHLLAALSPDLMPRTGRDTSAAIALAGQLLRRHGLPRGRLLLLTGEVEPGAMTRIPQLLPEGVTLSILGVGTPTGAPVASPRGLLKDEQGHLVLARLQTERLRELARRSGGTYHRLTLDDSDLTALQERALRTDAGEHPARPWVDRTSWLAALLLPLAAVGFRRGWLWLLPLLWLPPAPAQALDWSSWWLRPDQQGARLWQRDDPEAAARHFDDPAWRGSALYRAGEHAAAAEAFRGDDSAAGHYNRGNALARSGHLEAALEAYDQALAQRPDWTEAAENRALVEQLLAASSQATQPADGQQPTGDEGKGERRGEGEREREDADHSADDGPGKNSQEEPALSGEEMDDPEPPTGEADPSEDAPGFTQRPGDGQNGGDDLATEPGTASQDRSGDDPATDYWLRQIPDDPAPLLRRKFHYESQRRSGPPQRTEERTPPWQPPP